MSVLSQIVQAIEEKEADFGARLRAFLAGCDPEYHHQAEGFFGRYLNFISADGRDIRFGVDCFLQLRDSMLEERAYFIRNGKYRSTSFEEVQERVYNHPRVMQVHMHGLVLAQFLWPDQYHRFQFFHRRLPAFAGQIRRYLEIGGGHGLYAMEAARCLNPEARIDFVDISPHSLDLARGMTQGLAIQFHLLNIFDLPAGTQYDFITMGEVLEHVERPLELLSKVRELLAPMGRAYITTPANAPMEDHIYLFRNAQEIRDLFAAGGLKIEEETMLYAGAMPPAQAERLKMPLMYAAFVSQM